MDPITKYLNRIAYKFPKGYPDMNNAQDVKMLFEMVDQILPEANLAGRTTNYAKPTGAFYKYVELNKDSDNMDYETDKDAVLLDPKTFQVIDNISKGEKIKILDKKEVDLQKKGSSYITRIQYKGDEYYIRLSDILKPTGKQVDFVKVDLETKTKKDVFEPFKAGHGHEEQIVQLFVNTSGPNFEFKHNGEIFEIERIGAPKYSGKGNPKTDVFIKLNKPIAPYGDEIKLSLKASNATFVENWMLPSRFEQILDVNDGKKIILDTLQILNDKKIGSRSNFMYWFIKNAPYNSVKLTREQEYEAYSGEDKFGPDSEATANSYFKGEVPDTISKLIDQIQPITDLSADVGLLLRGGAQGGNAACYQLGEDGIWVVKDNWKKEFNID